MTDHRQLIDSAGRVRFGRFETTPELINSSDFDYRTPMGGKQNPLRKWADHKQFQYIGVICDELLLGCALGDFGYLGLAFVYTYEPRTGHLDEFSVKLPLGRGMSLTNRPTDGTSTVNTGGNKIVMAASTDPREVKLQIDLRSGLHADVTFNLDGPQEFEPLALCTQTAKTGWVFTQKIAGVSATGTVRGGFGEIDLAAADAHAHYDYSAGYMRRETFWNWACFAGRAHDHEDRPVIGLNLSCGVNETSYSENCFWVDGVLHPVGLATFEYDRHSPQSSTWSVSTQDGAVDLTFVPEGTHTERLNLLVLASNFKQLFGRFNGTLTTPAGETIPIRDHYGFVEDQYAKW